MFSNCVWTSFGSRIIYNCVLKHKTSKWCEITLALTWSLHNAVLKRLKIKVGCEVVLWDLIHNSRSQVSPLRGLWGQGHSRAITCLSSVLVKHIIIEAISTVPLTALWLFLEYTQHFLSSPCLPRFWGSRNCIGLFRFLASLYFYCWGFNWGGFSFICTLWKPWYQGREREMCPLFGSFLLCSAFSPV